MTSGGDPVVRPLAEDATAEAVQVLADAFRRYPVMRYVLDDAAESFRERLETLIRFFVGARHLRGEPVLGGFRDGRLLGVALVSNPAFVPSGPELPALREETWGRLGAEARARYERATQVHGPLLPDVPHLHLNMVGVLGEARGTGVGRALVEAVHGISAITEGSAGVTLTTEDPANVPFYRRLGYELISQVRVSDELESWAFFRADGS